MKLKLTLHFAMQVRCLCYGPLWNGTLFTLKCAVGILATNIINICIGQLTVCNFFYIFYIRMHTVHMSVFTLHYIIYITVDDFEFFSLCRGNTLRWWVKFGAEELTFLQLVSWSLTSPFSTNMVWLYQRQKTFLHQISPCQTKLHTQCCRDGMRDPKTEKNAQFGNMPLRVSLAQFLWNFHSL